jgi:hypothetical protein
MVLRLYGSGDGGQADACPSRASQALSTEREGRASARPALGMQWYCGCAARVSPHIQRLLISETPEEPTS